MPIWKPLLCKAEKIQIPDHISSQNFVKIVYSLVPDKRVDFPICPTKQEKFRGTLPILTRMSCQHFYESNFLKYMYVIISGLF